MPKTTFTSHPLHPQLISAPTSLLPFSLVMDVLHLATKRASYAESAYDGLFAGYLGGLAAAAGLGDYLELAPEHPAKKTVTHHALLNAGVLGLYTLNLLRERHRVGTLPFLLLVFGNLGLGVSAWYGGHLVYAYGVRVEAAASQVPDLSRSV